MAVSRSTAVELARLLDAADEPLYVLDDESRIVFCNQACARWLNCSPGELIGRYCRYHSSGETSGAEQLAAALCPPPDALAGRVAIANVTAPAPDGTLVDRPVEFRPLRREDGVRAGLIAIVLPAATADAPSAPPPPDSPRELHRRLQHYRREMEIRFHVDRLIGESPAMQRVRAQVRLAASSRASVVIVGPKGSGRAHVARAIHYSQPPATQTAGAVLVPLACSLLGAELLQTTIRALARAKVETAPATLLLNDVDLLPSEAQNELAGFLSAVELPMRIVGTARESLVRLAGQGGFRPDLAAALATLVIELPPLRERWQDLPLLAQWTIEDLNARGDKQLAGLSLEALDRLTDYAWPGDVAELTELIHQLHAQAAGPEIGVRDLPKRLLLSADATRYAKREDEKIVLDEFLARIERELIDRALAKAKGNKTKAAQLLGMNRPRFYRRLVQLGYEPPSTSTGEP